MAASQAAQAGSTPVSRSIHRGCLTKRQPLSACRNRLSAPQGSMPASARQPLGPGQFAERTGPRPCCRGGFYIRPEPGTVYPGPRWLRELDTDAPCAPLRWVRLTDCLGCRYRAGRCGHRPLRSAVGGGAARAAIKAAPTPHFRPGPFGGVPTPRQTAPPGSPGMLRKSQACPGGYIIRPYGPAHGLVVGAGFMPARNRVPIPAGVRWFRPPAPPDKAK